MDEDFFLEETLIRDEEILRNEEASLALSSRLSKWKRPPLSPSYLSLSQNISIHLSFSKKTSLLGFWGFTFIIFLKFFAFSFSAAGDRLRDWR